MAESMVMGLWWDSECRDTFASAEAGVLLRRAVLDHSLGNGVEVEVGRQRRHVFFVFKLLLLLAGHRILEFCGRAFYLDEVRETRTHRDLHVRGEAGPLWIVVDECGTENLSALTQEVILLRSSVLGLFGHPDADGIDLLGMGGVEGVEGAPFLGTHIELGGLALGAGLASFLGALAPALQNG